MTRHDLSRIITGGWHAECELRACDWASPEHSKAHIIREARKHVAATGHEVLLIAETLQRVTREGRGR